MNCSAWRTVLIPHFPVVFVPMETRGATWMLAFPPALSGVLSHVQALELQEQGSCLWHQLPSSLSLSTPELLHRAWNEHLLRWKGDNPQSTWQKGGTKHSLSGDVHLNVLLSPPEVPVRCHTWNIPSGEHWSIPSLSQEFLNCVKAIQVPRNGHVAGPAPL